MYEEQATANILISNGKQKLIHSDTYKTKIFINICFRKKKNYHMTQKFYKYFQ